jgi:hypothetical protein
MTPLPTDWNAGAGSLQRRGYQKRALSRFHGEIAQRIRRDEHVSLRVLDGELTKLRAVQDTLGLWSPRPFSASSQRLWTRTVPWVSRRRARRTNPALHTFSLRHAAA